MTQINNILSRETYSLGKLIIRQGSEGNTAYFIQSGTVQVYVEKPDGSEKIIAELGEGNLFGEMALLGNGRRSSNVRALEACVLIVIKSSMFDNAIGSSEALYKKLSKIMTQRLEENHKLYSQDMHDDLGMTRETAQALLGRLKDAFKK